MPLPAVFAAIGMGVNAGMIGSEIILAANDLYTTFFDRRQGKIGAMEASGKILDQITRISAEHYIILCSYPYEQYVREILPAMIETYRDAFSELERLKEEGAIINPIGVVPMFLRARVEANDGSNFTPEEWAAARSTSDCVNRPKLPQMPPPQKSVPPIVEKTGSMVAEIIVGVTVAVVSAILIRRFMAKKKGKAS